MAFALGPLAGLQVRERAGDSAVWTFTAILSVIVAVLILVIVRRLPNHGDGPAVSNPEPT